MTAIRFEVGPALDADPAMPVVYLSNDNWDDYNFRTLFGAIIVLPNGRGIDLGGVKIMRAGQVADRTLTEIRPEFRRLGNKYCSLGQDIEYYEKLAALPDDVRTAYLVAIRDAAADEEIEERFENEPAWETSLLRFGAALHALDAGRELMRRDDPRPARSRQWGRARFTFKRVANRWGQAGQNRLEVPFEFDDAGYLPGRCNVIIGYNGAGKTYLLAQMAQTASRVGLKDDPEELWTTELTGPDRTFGAVVAISYSAFDTFELPRTHNPGRTPESSFGNDPSVTTFFGYTYCGLRRADRKPIGPTLEHENRADELKSPSEIDDEFLRALNTARDRWTDEPGLGTPEDFEDFLGDALSILEQEPSFSRIGISPSSWVHDPRRALQEIGTLSTGHKIVANIVVQLAAHLRRRSLVLIDEPETHLHPPLLAALLRAIQRLLDAFDSFAIIATHSPVVLQEVPAEYVHVLRRTGDESAIERPQIETFGESISAITRQVFSLDSSATDYQGVIRELASEYTTEEAEDMFLNGLSSHARALFLRAKKEAN